MKKNLFSLVEILIVVAIIGMLAAIAYPNFTKARHQAFEKEREANVKMVDLAKERLSIDRNLPVGTEVTFNDLKRYMPLVGNIDALTVNNQPIKLGAIGTSASYSDSGN